MIEILDKFEKIDKRLVIGFLSISLILKKNQTDIQEEDLELFLKKYSKTPVWFSKIQKLIKNYGGYKRK